MKYEKIFLLGFRATGKSTIGKILADKLNWSFYDTDFLITLKSGLEIDSLTNNGRDWMSFRRYELEVLKELSDFKNAIISCGGGVGVNNVIDDKTNKTFGELEKDVIENTEKSMTVLLISNENKIRERLKRQYKNKKIMPFLNSNNAKNSESLSEEELIEKLVDDSIDEYKKRQPLYEKIKAVKINSDKKSLEDTAKEILENA